MSESEMSVVWLCTGDFSVAVGGVVVGHHQDNGADKPITVSHALIQCAKIVNFHYDAVDCPIKLVC